jgi:hypothetical protein
MTPPCPDRAVAAQREAVLPPGRDGNDVGHVADGDRNVTREAIIGRAVAELAKAIAAPGDDRAVGAQREAMSLLCTFLVV